MFAGGHCSAVYLYIFPHAHASISTLVESFNISWEFGCTFVVPYGTCTERHLTPYEFHSSTSTVRFFTCQPYGTILHFPASHRVAMFQGQGIVRSLAPSLHARPVFRCCTISIFLLLLMSNEIWRICNTNLIQTLQFIFLLSMLQHHTVVHTSTIRCVPCFPVRANLSQLYGTSISITVPALYRTTLCFYMATYRSVLHLSPYGMISPH